MTRDQRNSVVEYASSLSEEDLRWLGLRLTERLGGDLSEALTFLSKNTKVDDLLSSANSCWELFDLTDKIKDIVAKECKKKGVALKWGPQAA